MTIKQLQFYQIGSYPYPYATTGEGSALTVCKRFNDPALAFLTQTSYEDDIVFMHLHLSVYVEAGRFSSPTDHGRITGMCYEKQDNKIWAVQGSGVPSQQGDKLIALDADTGNLVQTINIPLDDGEALAFNGLQFVRSNGSTLDLINQAGNVLASRNVDIGSSCQGISASPWSYVASYTGGNRLVILNPFAQVIAECVAPPGSPNGIQAVAFDNILDFDHISQLPTDNGAVGAQGTPYHPDTPWDPEPYKFRHNVYLANEIDQTIYFGYFYE